METQHGCMGPSSWRFLWDVELHSRWRKNKKRKFEKLAWNILRNVLLLDWDFCEIVILLERARGSDFDLGLNRPNFTSSNSCRLPISLIFNWDEYELDFDLGLNGPNYKFQLVSSPNSLIFHELENCCHSSHLFFLSLCDPMRGISA